MTTVRHRPGPSAAEALWLKLSDRFYDLLTQRGQQAALEFAATLEEKPTMKHTYVDQRQLQARSAPGGIDKAGYAPWKKPRVIRSANSHAREGVSDREYATQRSAGRKGVRPGEPAAE